MNVQSRRDFLTKLGASALGVSAFGAMTAGHNPAAAADVQQRRKLERFGVQLYTVRNAFRMDAAGTLEKVAQAGYREVEFAGYNALPPSEVRALLSRFGLTSPSTHVGLPNNAEAFRKILDDSAMIGHEFVTAPSLPGGVDRTSVDGWKSLADRFNEAGAAAKAAGLRFAFHNHDAEFRPVQERIPFDVLVENTDPALVSFQIDIYWMTRAGHDTLSYYAKFPNRFPMVHVKDSSGPPEHTMVDVGKGKIDFAAIFARGVAQGTRHFFVEHDSPADPMASIRASAEHLAKLEF
jgi:sugar phosphate isomerase/epimerase